MHTTSSSHHRTPRRTDQIRQLLLDVMEQRSRGADVTDDEVLAQHAHLLPELAGELRKIARIHSAMQQAEETQYRAAIDQIEADWRRDDHCPDETGQRQSPQDDELDDLPIDRIGRYRIEGCLGEGGFGRVYLAHDEQLGREVAIKIPHRRRAAQSTYLAEASIVAGLDHPAIVPVYDVGHTDGGHCYVVSKWIPGQDLAARLAESPLPFDEVVHLVTIVADALDYAHDHGLVHRDIKPANILLDAQGRPYVVDFGLALKDEDLSGGNCYAGTPAYMSPEQARGEAHRVDGRADIFSLGVLLYELLTGKKPFYASSYDELREQIETVDPRPPRSWDATVPKELERICLKAMSKRAADRYTRAGAMADDLRYYADSAKSDVPSTATSDEPATGGGDSGLHHRIIPKGLRPYDAGDANFFLRLLPGSRDRDGLPTSVSQWTSNIQQPLDQQPFSIGLLYGPSGCGKSSFVRAGLLPHLSPSVHSIYIEATSEDTEQRLLKRIQRDYVDLEDHTTLLECLADVRRGRGPGSHQKLLLVIDQFEQWLQGKGEDERRVLLHALRQCDGRHLQCLLLVRDDFWLAVSRFMADLEVDLLQGWNSGLVDLFDRQHARKVLVELGQSFGRLPNDLQQMDSGQTQFLDRAIAALQEDDRVVPVRLVLFAEMVKDKPWIPATLRNLGGASGVGVAFLEDTFSARSANPQYRLHEPAVRAVLSALLPSPGSHIRSQTRSEVELLDISGYRKKPRLFKDLMRVLDSETRLLTPVDPEVTGAFTPFDKPTGRFFQLTHDYLVPSLRQWLTRKKRATRSGRVELRLAERATMWNAMPERRQLPSAWEWMSIRSMTRPSAWTDSQRRMMRAAARKHARSFLLVFALLLVFLFSGLEVTAIARNLLMKFRAHGAMVWMALGQERTVWQMLRTGADPSTRTHVVHAIGPFVTSPEELLAEQALQVDDSVRRAMLLIAGEIVGDPSQRNLRAAALRKEDPIVPTLLELYRFDPDPGVHAATDWLLFRYGQAGERRRLDQQIAFGEPQGDRQWYVNRRGHTMAWIPGPANFAMGEPVDQAEQPESFTRRLRRIRRSYCIASKETTVSQFSEFLQAEPRHANGRQRPPKYSGNMPQAEVTWYDAAAYCNWLSAREGIPEAEWCYEPNAVGEYGPGMRIADDYFSRRGYRLPTEAEWEYACRAGSDTEYYFGNNVRHLKHYAAYRDFAGQPREVGAGKPNDFGLFDMSGNVAEWCQDAHDGQATGLATTQLAVLDRQDRMVRGGAFADSAQDLRSCSRGKCPPHERRSTVGFRVARTFP